ncbi:MAG: hypothetical protein M1823_006505, partial [Watsoniomyces obsoletus]
MKAHRQQPDSTDDRESTTSDDVRPIDGPSLGTTPLEDQVAKHSAHVRAKMVKRYGQQHTIEKFKEGDLVTVSIPREDRSATDNRRLPCFILAVPHHDRFQLQIEYGVLRTHYPTRELLRVPDDLASDLHRKLQLARLSAPQ